MRNLNETNHGEAIDAQAAGDQLVRETKLLSRKELQRRWKEASYGDVVRYNAGYNTDQNGEVYRHERGARLVILGENVMDTCESPWADATVDLAFSELRKRADIEILERGFGMGLVATEAVRHLSGRGGNYSVIELNDDVADYAEGEWKKKQELHYRGLRQSTLGGEKRKPAEVGITIIRGDAVEQTQVLANEGRKFDIIISDTYPLTEDEQGFNDINDLETVVRCLNPDGVFAFFGYHPGSEEDLDQAQWSLVRHHFGTIHIDQAYVLPPKSYKYLNAPNGAVTILPVIICTNPKFPQD